MKYIVKIGFYEFEFKGGIQALGFAEMARDAWANEDEYRHEVAIKIEKQEEREEEK